MNVSGWNSRRQHSESRLCLESMEDTMMDKDVLLLKMRELGQVPLIHKELNYVMELPPKPTSF